MTYAGRSNRCLRSSPWTKTAVQTGRPSRRRGQTGKPADQFRGQYGGKTVQNVARNGENGGREESDAEEPKTLALPGITPKNQGKNQMGRGGVEPPTHGFSVRCSTN